MSKEKPGSYRSYLLRCWQEKPTRPGQPPLWRFSVQDVSEAQRQQAFSSIEQLIDFLYAEFQGGKPKPEESQDATTV